MTLSVIMSVYNSEKYLAQALRSILTQTYRDFEFLIVDDGSTDMSAEILMEVAEQDRRIKIITNPTNIGLTASLNKALRAARGALIGRMDADDIALPERFMEQITFLESHHDVGVVGTAYEFIDAAGNSMGKKSVLTESNELRNALIRSNPFLHSSVMIRKDLLDRVHGYDERYSKAQDYDLWMRLSPLCHLANLSEALMKKRFTSGMISYAQERKQIQCALRVRSQALRRGEYPWWCVVFLVKPFLAIVFPAFFVRYVRVHFYKQERYARALT